ncbi:hypothetical protein ANCDUO_22666 [Ancylostoma duodenale]|uniref:PH domain-containing protein n=1 Tax=Ancylostoma duodenale TaxID=51022 RepID=A0A0C2CBQ5_9BILA|nr:hypothetical protein ANCDUO_22666 [Ancylostoma duodenale]
MKGTSAAMSMTSLSTKSRRPEDIIIEGWLHKKGEHIKNWRPSGRNQREFRSGATWHISSRRRDRRLRCRSM